MYLLAANKSNDNHKKCGLKIKAPQNWDAESNLWY